MNSWILAGYVFAGLGTCLLLAGLVVANDAVAGIIPVMVYGGENMLFWMFMRVFMPYGMASGASYFVGGVAGYVGRCQKLSVRFM
ncbi:MAG TPA: hypothetical protein VF893_04560 [Candidatus Bathyarchaeia archaeon]